MGKFSRSMQRQRGKRREASDARILEEREAAHAARQTQTPTPPTSDCSSDGESTTTTNTATPETEKLMQAYHNSSTAEKKNESLSDILYAAADELFADKNSSTTDWRLQRVIQAVTGALEDLNTFTTEPKTGRHLNRRFQSRTEGSVLPTHDHIQSKAVDRVLHIPLLRRLSQYQKWSGKPSSWQLWYQGLNRAYHDDFRTGLDPANADHASRAWNTILDKLPEQVTVKLLNEGVLVPERPDPHQLLVHLNRFISSEYL